MASKPMFRRGDRVEISSKEDGLLGSYFMANIIAYLGDKEYIVRYRTLLEEDHSSPLREIISEDIIRPAPPYIPATKFSVSDDVDAYENDGWWVGKISRKVGSNYIVQFKYSNEEIAYPLNLLRIHQNFVDGVWVSSKKLGHGSKQRGSSKIR